MYHSTTFYRKLKHNLESDIWVRTALESRDQRAGQGRKSFVNDPLPYTVEYTSQNLWKNPWIELRPTFYNLR